MLTDQHCRDTVGMKVWLPSLLRFTSWNCVPTGMLLNYVLWY